jgi:hypothetical protein
MNLLLRHRLLAALAAAAVGLAAGAVTVAPSGCASDCGSNCPEGTAVIEAESTADPGIIGLAWDGPACPLTMATCRGNDQTTFCQRINVTARAPGACDVLVVLYGRDPMVVHLEFGPPSGIGCCKGFPVVGDSHFTIPYNQDASIYSGDGNTDAVTILRDAGTNTGDAAADANDGGAD